MAYPDCRWCGGAGCIQCEAERRKDADAKPKEQGAINVHLQSPRQLTAVRDEIIRRTGQEPVICLHLYCASVEDLEEAIRTRSPGDARRESALERLFAQAQAAPSGSVEFPRILESEELKHAREMRDKWAAHSSGYAREQVAFFEREIDRLIAERDAPAAPADDAPDAEEIEDDEDEKAGRRKRKSST